MSVIKSRCPVPPEQLPLNQYEAMRDSWFYSWGGRDLMAFGKPVVILWLLSWVVAGPIVGASFHPSKAPGPFLLLTAASALGLPLLTLMQLYFGWLHVGQRLQQAAVPYEESGWYDGQVWEKPEDVLSRDRLIMDYQVKPILKRVRNTMFILLSLGVALVTTWQVV